MTLWYALLASVLAAAAAAAAAGAVWAVGQAWTFTDPRRSMERAGILAFAIVLGRRLTAMWKARREARRDPKRALAARDAASPP